MARHNRRFTIYDMLENKGFFESNPANPGSIDSDGNQLYKGPVKYPMMFYHPTGATRITVPAEIVMTPMGPTKNSEQREVIWQLANNAEDEKRLRTDGWHDHPAKAIAAGGGEAPAMSSAQVIADLEEKIRQLQLEKNTAQAHELAQSKMPPPRKEDQGKTTVSASPGP